MSAKLWKLSNYRPNRIIERDPAERTYDEGDDKFQTLVTVDNLTVGAQIVREHNALVGLNPDALKDVISGLQDINRDAWSDDNNRLRPIARLTDELLKKLGVPTA